MTALAIKDLINIFLLVLLLKFTAYCTPVKNYSGTTGGPPKARESLFIARPECCSLTCRIW